MTPLSDAALRELIEKAQQAQSRLTDVLVEYRLAAAPTWQPIATAPKDGTRVLLSAPNITTAWIGWWHCYNQYANAKDQRGYWCAGHFAAEPTAWMLMPLPPPPLAPSAEPPTED